VRHILALPSHCAVYSLPQKIGMACVLVFADFPQHQRTQRVGAIAGYDTYLVQAACGVEDLAGNADILPARP
jgi:hypothetical protein